MKLSSCDCVISSFPFLLSSSSCLACLKCFLKKFLLSLSFRLLRLRIRSALRRLARFFFTSSHSGFRPSFSSLLAFLHCFRSWRRLFTSCSISLSLLPFCFEPFCFSATTPNLFLHSSYRMSPMQFSLVSTWPRSECSRMKLRSSSSYCHTATLFAFGHLTSCLCPGSFLSVLWPGSWLLGFVDVDFLRVFSPVPPSEEYVSTKDPPVSSTCLPSATLEPSALWLATWLWAPLV